MQVHLFAFTNLCHSQVFLELVNIMYTKLSKKLGRALNCPADCIYLLIYFLQISSLLSDNAALDK